MLFLPKEVETVITTLQSAGYSPYLVGGCVREMLRGKAPSDYDMTSDAPPQEVLRLFSESAHPTGLQHGTVTVVSGGLPIELTTMRRDGAYRDNRHPDSVTFGTSIEEDLARRDFTVNALAIAVNADNFGELVDPFGGLDDMRRRIIRTPLDPDVTFSDDPLRMMRAVRFATQLDFEILPETFDAITRNRERIAIITRERIAVELEKIVCSPRPSLGFMLLEKCGLLELIFPELHALKGVETKDGRGHKDNFLHTMQVLDSVAEKSDKEWLRWAALFHDIAKPVTKQYDQQHGWTFYNHNFVGKKMIPGIFKRMKLPMNEKMKYVQKLVELHMRPIALVEEEVTDSAVRRLLFDAGDDIDDLMILCEADITSKNPEKVKRFLSNYQEVRRKLVEIEEKDRIRNFQPPIDGDEIMRIFGLSPCREVGDIKERLKNAILDGDIPNEREAAYKLMLKVAAEMGLKQLEE